MLNKFFKESHIYLIIVIISASVVTMLSAFLTYKNSINAAEDSLKLQAMGIAVSLEASLKNSSELRVTSDELKGQKNIFKDLITEGKWEGIAFLALYDREGMTLLHSNERLIGRQAGDDSIHIPPFHPLFCLFRASRGLR